MKKIILSYAINNFFSYFQVLKCIKRTFMHLYFKYKIVWFLGFYFNLINNKNRHNKNKLINKIKTGHFILRT